MALNYVFFTTIFSTAFAGLEVNNILRLKAVLFTALTEFKM